MIARESVESHMTLNGLLSLLTKEKINAFGSIFSSINDLLVESHASSVNPQKMLSCSDLITVSVFAIPSHSL